MDGGRRPHPQHPHARYLGMTRKPPFGPVSPSELDHAGVRYWPVPGIEPGPGPGEMRGEQRAAHCRQRSLASPQPPHCLCSAACCTKVYISTWKASQHLRDQQHWPSGTGGVAETREPKGKGSPGKREKGKGKRGKRNGKGIHMEHNTVSHDLGWRLSSDARGAYGGSVCREAAFPHIDHHAESTASTRGRRRGGWSGWVVWWCG